MSAGGQSALPIPSPCLAADTARNLCVLKPHPHSHARCVPSWWPCHAGDTIGDPFKDTSGPALNVLIKTMTMMALMLAPGASSSWRCVLVEWLSTRDSVCRGDRSRYRRTSRRSRQLPRVELPSTTAASPEPDSLSPAGPSAAAYQSFGEYAGFGKTGSTIGAIMLVVISVLCYGLVSYFNRVNAAAFKLAIEKKRAADAKLAAGAYGGPGGDVEEEAGGHHHAAGGRGERDSLVTPLIRA
jgi:hypothetical protein